MILHIVWNSTQCVLSHKEFCYNLCDNDEQLFYAVLHEPFFSDKTPPGNAPIFTTPLPSNLHPAFSL